MYRVLWFDDQHQDLNKFKLEAKTRGIELIGFKSKESGLDELSKNPINYSAILFDARFFLCKEDQPGSESLTALKETRNEINKFHNNYKSFILTGQKDINAKESQLREMFDDELYVKGDPESIEKLWIDLTHACENNENFQIRIEHQQLFESIDSFDSISETQILELLKNAYSKDNTKWDFGKLRLRLEAVTKTLKSVNYIPQDLNSLNDQVRFITGRHNRYTLNSSYFDPTLCYSLNYLLQILQDGSHDKEELNLKVNEHIKKFDNPYLYTSALFILSDYIICTAEFLSTKPTSNNWRVSDSYNNPIEGEVKKDEEGFFYCENCSILPDKLINLEISIGQSIIITEYVDNTKGRTKHKYQYFAIKLKPTSKQK